MAIAIQNRLKVICVDNIGLLLLTLFVISMAPAHAEDASSEIIVISGYDVNLTPAELEHVDRSGMDRQVSFFDLPIGVQVAYISGSIGTIIGSLIIFPAVICKIKSPLTNKNRESIFEFIAQNPGCIIPHIIKKKNIPKSTTRFHLKILEDEGKLIIKHIGKFSRLFISSHAISEKEKLIASYTSNKTDRMFLYTILQNKGVTNKELSNRFNMNKSLISWHLKKFLDANVIEFRQEGKYKKYFICSDSENILAKYVKG